IDGGLHRRDAPRNLFLRGVQTPPDRGSLEPQRRELLPQDVVDLPRDADTLLLLRPAQSRVQRAQLRLRLPTIPVVYRRAHYLHPESDVAHERTLRVELGQSDLPDPSISSVAVPEPIFQLERLVFRDRAPHRLDLHLPVGRMDR